MSTTTTKHFPRTSTVSLPFAVSFSFSKLISLLSIRPTASSFLPSVFLFTDFSFILALWSLLSPAGSNNKHSTLDFLQATQLKGQDPSPGHEIYNALTLTSAAPRKTEPCAEIAMACKMYNCLTLMSVLDVNKRGN